MTCSEIPQKCVFYCKVRLWRSITGSSGLRHSQLHTPSLYFARHPRQRRHGKICRGRWFAFLLTLDDYWFVFAVKWLMVLKHFQKVRKNQIQPLWIRFIGLFWLCMANWCLKAVQRQFSGSFCLWTHFSSFEILISLFWCFSPIFHFWDFIGENSN